MNYLKKFFFKLKTWATDHYHLLFKSAADNHLRIQNLLKNSDGTYQLTVKFGSYSELKNYQKKLRRMTVSLSSAIAMVIVAFIVAPYVMNPNKSSANSFAWNQSDWSGGGTDVAPFPKDPTNKTGWTKYAQTGTNAGLTTTSNSVSLTLPAASSTGEANAADSNHTAYAAATGFYLDSSTNNLTLSKSFTATCSGTPTNECATNLSCTGGTCKKVNGQSCSAAGDCASSFCSSGSTCCADACCGTSSISDANGTTYGTVAIGTQCWMNSNMRTPKKPDGTSLTLGTDYFCYNISPTDPNCATASSGNKDASGYYYGALYTWHAAMNVASSSDSALLNAGANYQGICPSGWHIPTDTEQYTLENSLKDTSQTCAASRTAYDCSSAGTKLKSGGTSGFNMPLAGSFNGGGGYVNRDNAGDFWSTTENGATYAWRRSLNSGYVTVLRTNYFKTYGFSVRCIKN